VLRRELEYALERDKPVIPILIEDTRMPEALEFPELIRPITNVNAPRLRRDNFSSDGARIHAVLQGLIEGGEERSKRFIDRLEELDELEKTDPEAAKRARDDMMLPFLARIGQVLTTKAQPGKGVPERDVVLFGAWECDATRRDGTRLFLRIVMETARLFSGELRRFDRQGRELSRRDLRGEWAHVVDRDQKLILGLQLSAVALGEGSLELTIPFDRRVADVMVGQDAEGAQYTSRNVAPRPRGF
jgi:hypothetical protein